MIVQNPNATLQLRDKVRCLFTHIKNNAPGHHCIAGIDRSA
jgi:hypothetical protein